MGGVEGGWISSRFLSRLDGPGLEIFYGGFLPLRMVGVDVLFCNYIYLFIRSERFLSPAIWDI